FKPTERQKRREKRKKYIKTNFGSHSSYLEHMRRQQQKYRDKGNRKDKAGSSTSAEIPQRSLARSAAAFKRENAKLKARVHLLETAAKQRKTSKTCLRVKLHRANKELAAKSCRLQTFTNIASHVKRALQSVRRFNNTRRVIKAACLNAHEAGRKAVMAFFGASAKILKQPRAPKINLLVSVVQEYFCQDENSRATSSRKDCISKRFGEEKETKQKRYLLSSVSLLHAKFLWEYPGVKISRATFNRWKPWYVKRARLCDRDMCMCIKCTNTESLIKGMHIAGLLHSHHITKVLNEMVCDMEYADCLLRKCDECRRKSFVVTETAEAEPQVVYRVWKPRTDGRSGLDVVKETASCKTAISMLMVQLVDFAGHFMRMRNQYRAIRQVKDTLQPGQLLLHIDFSENYTAKYHKEVQAAHFGDKDQVVLHQGVAYMAGHQPCSFATVSGERSKTAEAIAAHLQPVLRHFKEKHDVDKDAFSQLDQIVIVSDSPSSQYRNRKMVFLFDRLMKIMRVSSWRWIYTEAGHGKGAADGVGAAIKRRCDEVVASRQDVVTPQDVMEAVRSGSPLHILTWLVQPEDMNYFTSIITFVGEDLCGMPGSKSMHDVSRTDGGPITYRQLSCMCPGTAVACPCHEMKVWAPLMLPEAPAPDTATSGLGCGRGGGRGRRGGRGRGGGRRGGRGRGGGRGRASGDEKALLPYDFCNEP
ncbi:hypothetical protein BOX15_Mlig001506g19, partial [Macrostomum lignano]